MPNSRKLLLGLAALLVLVGTSTAQEMPSGCGSLYSTGRFGPYDYRPDRYVPETTYRSHAALLAIVENYHFTKDVEMLIRGKTGELPGGDISYTLHAFPNHHRALAAMVGLAKRGKTEQPSGSSYRVECWFHRATLWRPDDQIVRMLYADYLVGLAREKEAEDQLRVAANLAGESAFTYRNIGMIYLSMKRFDEALGFAHKASELGLNIEVLRDRLQQVGKWREAPTPMQPAASAPAGPLPSVAKD